MGGQACVLYGAADYSRDVDLGVVPPLRVDIMSHMRDVAPFEELWERRTTIALADPSSPEEILVDLLSLGDLVHVKKTQRDKDWPMLRRLVDESYASARDADVSFGRPPTSAPAPSLPSRISPLADSAQPG